MVKRKSILVIKIMLLLVLSVPAIARAEAGKTPGAYELVEKFRDAVTSLESYSYTIRCINDGDEFVVARHKQAMEDYEPIISKIELVTRKKLGSEVKPEYETVSGVRFMSPFTMQVSLDRDDYLPKLLEGSRGFYRPEVNEYEVFLKEPIIGLVFRRPVEENDSGHVMVINWTYNLLELDCTLANGGVPRVTGAEEYDGNSTHILEVGLGNEEAPWIMPCGENDYGVPEGARIQVDRELKMMSQRIDKYKGREGVLKLWIDDETGLSLKKEVTFGGKVSVQHWITDIELNKVDEKELLRARRPKRR